MAEKTTSNSSENAPTHRRLLFRALEAKSLRSRSNSTRAADYLTGLSSTPTFLFLNIIFFAVWIILNINVVPGVEAFDPFPFGLLTMAVSLEAIVLSIFVLVSQNRAAQIATLREEMHLRINLIAEREITKILEILAEMRAKSGIKREDAELQEMLKTINASDLEQSITQQLVRAEHMSINPLPFSKGEFPHLLNSLLNPKK